jgi:L-ascorbate metabolism protein UlaG (beta-lactamase superfamily)
MQWFLYRKGGTLAPMRHKQFGARVTKEHLTQYASSANWKNGKFQNLEHTTLNISVNKIPELIYKQLVDRGEREPKLPIPIHPFDLGSFVKPSKKARFIWYGHSVVLARIQDLTILIDPMLGPNASPIAPVTTRRFSDNTLDLIHDFTDIDLLLLTHDHYDHLDLASIELLKSKTKKYYVALGVKRHLVSWGISPDLITEFDWWDQQKFNSIDITFTPTRHFSGRGLTDRAKSLWGGWVFKTPDESIWFSGDGGYGNHFIEIGQRLGPFDFAFMECGQYNENWNLIHLFPEESIQAAIDAGVSKIMPVHWAGFALALHKWTDPAERFYKEAQRRNIEAIFPQKGKLFEASSSMAEKWWNSHR